MVAGLCTHVAYSARSLFKSRAKYSDRCTEVVYKKNRYVGKMEHWSLYRGHVMVAVQNRS